jgi:integrin beta 8
LHANARASGQELGSTGSCIQTFSTALTIRCDIKNECSYAINHDTSYWLSTSEPMKPSMTPINGPQLKNHISRCSVCEAPANVSLVEVKKLKQSIF